MLNKIKAYFIRAEKYKKPGLIYLPLYSPTKAELFYGAGDEAACGILPCTARSSPTRGAVAIVLRTRLVLALIFPK